MAEYEIVLQLRAPGEVGNEALEEHMLEVLGVVEGHARDVALGPVVAVDLEKRHIDLGFCVEAESLEQAQSRVASVLRTIEEYSAVQFTPVAASSNVAAHAGDCTLAVA